MNAPQRMTEVAAAAADTADGASELNRLLQRAPNYSPRDDLLGDKFDRMMRIAELMAKSHMAVPPYLRENVGACFAVVQQAMRWNADPWAVALKTHVVNEMVSYESQLIGAVLNASGAIQEAALQDEYFGPWEKVIGNFVERESKYQNKDGSAKTYRKLNTTLEDEKGVGIRVSATLVGESQPRVLTLQMSQASVRNSTLWADDPQQQLFYLAQKRWARKYTPGVILGLYSPDELEQDEDKAPHEHQAPAAPRGPQRKSAVAHGAAASAVATKRADPQTGEIDPPAAPGQTSEQSSTTAKPATPAPGPAAKSAAPGPDAARPSIGTGQVAYLRNKLKAAGITEQSVLARYGVGALEQLNVDAFDELKSELLASS